MSLTPLQATHDALLGAAARKGVQLPENIDSFEYADAPLFHSIIIGTSCMVLTEDQCEQVVDFALQQPHTDCSPAVMRFVDDLVG